MSCIYKIEYCCVNIKGGVREQNQDNFYAGGRYRLRDEKENDIVENGILYSDNNSILAIYDGMGGESNGDIASFIAASRTSLFDNKKGDAKQILIDLCQYLNAEICDFSSKNNICCMGTTAAILRFTSNYIFACNLGDSRIFKIDKDFINQISQDHVLCGYKTSKPPLTQYLGIPPTELNVEPYITKLQYNEKDMFLICSDGVTDMLKNNEIFQTVHKNSDVQIAAKQLVSGSLKKGGYDNITAILCKIKKCEKESIIKKILNAFN